MLAFLKALVLLPVAVIVILLAIANRGPVAVSLDPFTPGTPELAFTIPLYGLVLAVLAAGVVVGGIGAWLSGGRHRRSGRSARRDAARWKREAEQLRARPAPSAPIASHHPALPAPQRSA